MTIKLRYARTTYASDDDGVPLLRNGMFFLLYELVVSEAKLLTFPQTLLMPFE